MLLPSSKFKVGVPISSVIPGRVSVGFLKELHTMKQPVPTDTELKWSEQIRNARPELMNSVKLPDGHMINFKEIEDFETSLSSDKSVTESDISES